MISVRIILSSFHCGFCHYNIFWNSFTVNLAISLKSLFNFSRQLRHFHFNFNAISAIIKGYKNQKAVFSNG